MAARVQLASFRRSPVTTLLTIFLPLNLLVLLSMFALTGYRAPTALVLGDQAVQAAAAIFAERLNLPGIQIRPQLRNTLHHDTGYVEYLGVSAIALSAVIAGGVLGGTVTAREWESGGARLLAVTPGGPRPVIL